jgi:hypothetical protein
VVSWVVILRVPSRRSPATNAWQPSFHGLIEHRPTPTSCGPNPCRMNTCKSVSKQRTLTSFRMNTYEKRGGGGSNSVVTPLPSCFAFCFQQLPTFFFRNSFLPRVPLARGRLTLLRKPPGGGGQKASIRRRLLVLLAQSASEGSEHREPRDPVAETCFPHSPLAHAPASVAPLHSCTLILLNLVTASESHRGEK